MGRAPCCEKVGLKKGRWSAEEDEILLNYIKANGEGSWRSLPKNAGLLRCGKSCRLRWINYLRDDIKRGSISKEEEEVIIKLHASLGNRWSLIAGQLPGRTDNEIKNYWNSHLSRRIDTFRRFNHNNLNNIVTIPTTQINSKERSGRTTRMKKKNHNPSTTQDNMEKAQTTTTTTTTDNNNNNNNNDNNAQTADHVHTLIPSDNINDNELLQWFDEVVNGTDQEQEGAISSESTCQRKELNEQQYCLQELEMEGIHELQTELWDDVLYDDCWFGGCGSDSDFKPMQDLENWLFSDMV